MESALSNFLLALGQFAQMNVDLAAASRNLKATSASCDGITGQLRQREAVRAASTQEGRA